MLTNETWLPFHLKESAAYAAFIGELSLDDTSGIGSAVADVARQPLRHRPSGVLLTGESGCGKHNAAYHIVQALSEEAYLPFFLTGKTLSEGADGFSDLTTRLNYLFDHMYDEHQGLCLLLDEPETCEWSTELYSFLGRTALEYAAHIDSFPPLFLILISKEPPVLDALLRKKLLRCECVLPTKAERDRYLAEYGKMIAKTIDLTALSGMMSGCSYADLEQVIDALGFHVDRLGRSPNKAELTAFVKPFLPVPKEENAVANAISHLEAALGNLSFSSAAPVAEKQPFANAETSAQAQPDPSAERVRIEALPPRQLAYELFGEEKTKALLQN